MIRKTTINTTNKKRMKDIEGQTETEISMCDKCFDFWAYKHPYLFLWIFIVLMFLMALLISSQ
jgi:hypothetical protein